MTGGTKWVSTTEIKTYKTCRELHRFQYGLGYRPRARAHALRFGVAFHASLESWWQTGHVHVALEAARDACEAEGLGAYERAKLEALTIAYDARWLPEWDRYEVLAVEERFRLLRPGPYQLVGIFDGLVRDRRDDRVLVLEHKTSSDELDAGGFYWRRLTLDDQLGLYFDAAESLGYRADGCLYDVIRKPTLEVRKATPVDKRRYRKKDGKLDARQRERDETPDEYADRVLAQLTAKPDAFFSRAEVVRLEHERERDKRDIDRVALEILNTNPDEPQVRSPESCRRYGRICPFFDVCIGAAELDSASFEQRKGARS